MCERLGSKRYTKISLSPEIEKGKKKFRSHLDIFMLIVGFPGGSVV